jgi:hypothetical protein
VSGRATTSLSVGPESTIADEDDADIAVDSDISSRRGEGESVFDELVGDTLGITGGQRGITNSPIEATEDEIEDETEDSADVPRPADEV